MRLAINGSVVVSLLLLAGCGHMRSGQYYRIQSGDTVDSVSRKLGVEPAQIRGAGEFKQGRLVYVSGKSSRRRALDGLKPPAGELSRLPATVRASEGEFTRKTRTADHAGVRVATLKDFQSPLRQYRISSAFGSRNSRRPHDGIDLVAPSGTEVLSSAEGVVVYSGRRIRGYGNMVIIRHEGGLSTVYAHNRKNFVKAGDPVQRGQIIASVGSTGRASTAHLHFELRQGTKPVDPLFYLRLK